MWYIFLENIENEKKMLIIIWVVHNLTLLLEKYIKTLFNEILTIATTKKLSFWEKGYW